MAYAYLTGMNSIIMRLKGSDIGLIALAVLAIGIAGFLWYRPAPKPIEVPNIIYGTTTPLADPVRLIIPKIGVDANVQHVGLAKSGAMAVPTNYTDVGWYRLGAKPGEPGNAVMAGHLDNGYGRPAVFLHLADLKQGDLLIVRDASGKEDYFLVDHTAVYDVSDPPLDEIFGTSTEVHLNLITCDGIFNPAKKMYNERLVVYAKAAPPSTP